MKAALLLLAACAAPAERTDVAAVTNGAQDLGDVAVAALVDDTGQVGCTATAIADYVAITAAHCIAGRDPRTLSLVFGPDAATGTTTPVSAGYADPAYDAPTFAHDVALLVFRDQAPMTLPLAPGPFAAGDQIRVVGFGATAGGASDAGTKRFGTATLSSVTAEELIAAPAPSQPCRGDSGGPALVAGGIAGVVSHGDAACSDHATYARIDASVVEGFLVTIQPNSAAAGMPCLYPTHCADAPCVQAADDPLIWYCSRACAHDSDCPDAMSCDDHACRYPLPTPGALGSPCDGDAACTSHSCRDSACTRSCLAEACPSNFGCEGSGLDRYCVVEGNDGCGCAAGGGGAASLLAALSVLALARARRTSRRASPRDSRG